MNFGIVIVSKRSWKLIIELKFVKATYKLILETKIKSLKIAGNYFPENNFGTMAHFQSHNSLSQGCEINLRAQNSLSQAVSKDLDNFRDQNKVSTGLEIILKARPKYCL